MARTVLTKSTVTRNTSNTATATAIDIANDHYIDLSGVADHNLTILLQPTNTATLTTTIKAGVGQALGQGDITIATAAAGLRAITIDSARFKDADGYILIDLVAGSGTTPTGNIYVLVNA
jgi:hypothetical protein